MDNVIAGTPDVDATDIYPEQNLTTTHFVVRGAPPYFADARAPQQHACSLVPQPASSYAACINNAGPPPPRKFYTGRDVGDFRMTGSDELVNIPGHYVPASVLRDVQQCDIRQTALQRGSGWQSYNISSECSGSGGGGCQCFNCKRTPSTNWL